MTGYHAALRRLAAERPDLRKRFLARKELAERECPPPAAEAPLVKFARVWSPSC